MRSRSQGCWRKTKPFWYQREDRMRYIQSNTRHFTKHLLHTLCVPNLSYITDFQLHELIQNTKPLHRNEWTSPHNCSPPRPQICKQTSPHLKNDLSPPVAVSQLAVLAFPPGVELALGGEGQAVLASRVDGHLLDEDVLDGLQQGGRAHGLRAADPQAPARAVPCAVHLGGDSTNRVHSGL